MKFNPKFTNSKINLIKWNLTKGRNLGVLYLEPLVLYLSKDYLFVWNWTISINNPNIPNKWKVNIPRLFSKSFYIHPHLRVRVSKKCPKPDAQAQKSILKFLIKIRSKAFSSGFILHHKDVFVILNFKSPRKWKSRLRVRFRTFRLTRKDDHFS